MDTGEVIGLIAGTGRLPPILAEAVKTRGHRLVCVTVEGEGKAVAEIADYSYRTAFGQIDQILAIFRSHEVHRVLLAGRVPRTLLVGGGDAGFRQGLAGLSDRRDHNVFLLFEQLLAQIGANVASPLEFVNDLVVKAGALTLRVPSSREWEDIRLGMTVACDVAALDVGQTVVVKDGVILAVEAAEGTDATIQRGGGMTDGACVVKVARPKQDDRFDLPTIGTQTIETLRLARASVLAVEAGRTLLLDRAQSVAAADRGGIALVGVEPAAVGARSSGSRP